MDVLFQPGRDVFKAVFQNELLWIDVPLHGFINLGRVGRAKRVAGEIAEIAGRPVHILAGRLHGRFRVVRRDTFRKDRSQSCGSVA